MKLVIVIPAYNEEQSIESIIERSLDARSHIMDNSSVTAVDVTVVSDGSYDRTVELAGKYTDHINLIDFPENRGYGAAIKEGWNQSDAELLSFLDADGTCDPRLLKDLCNKMEEENADIVLGCRLNENSQMPFVRRLGNMFFALMLTVFSSTRVRDTASGMRVVKRSCLHPLMPLPDGLHFTPAMSARAVLSKDLRIAEVDMPYREREGESKLSALRDGIRFFRVILRATFLYRASRPLGIAGVSCLLVSLLLIAHPVVYYLQNRSVLEWMIYRLIVTNLLGVAGCLFLCFSYLCRRIVGITISSASLLETRKGLTARVLAHPLFWCLPLAMMLAGGLLVLPSFIELVRTGATYEHWSRFVAMSGLYSMAFILIITKIVDRTLDLIAERLDYLRD